MVAGIFKLKSLGEKICKHYCLEERPRHFRIFSISADCIIPLPPAVINKIQFSLDFPPPGFLLPPLARGSQSLLANLARTNGEASGSTGAIQGVPPPHDAQDGPVWVESWVSGS